MISIIDNKLNLLGANNSDRVMKSIERRAIKFENFHQNRILNYTYSKSKWHIQNAQKSRIKCSGFNFTKSKSSIQ